MDGGFITAADMRYHFFVTDHLGNVRVVVNDAGLVEQVNQFYPYGESTDMGQGVLDSVGNPYKWSGKEWDEDQGAYDFGARMYSAADARWTTMDPLSEKYYHISPYAYCAGNPVNLVDPDGRDIYLFDEQGNYLRKVEQKGRNRAAIRSEDKDGNVHISYYDFADPKNDAKDIDDGIINEIMFVSAETIDGYLRGSGTYGDNVFGITESRGEGRYDFFSQYVSTYKDYQRKLFIPEGQRVAHNAQNFGNFLWGAACSALGIPTIMALTLAQINSRFDPYKANGYKHQWDSIDDQLSIFFGSHYSPKHQIKKAKR